MRIMQSLLSWRSSFNDKNVQSPSRFRAWAFLLSAAAILTLLLSTTSSSFADSATWLASPATKNWNNASNWTPATVPNGPSDTATFDFSNKTGVSIRATTEVNGIVFNAGASAFTIAVVNTTQLTISGVGITNNSGITQNFVTAIEGNEITFTNSATAGSLTAFTNNGGGAFPSRGSETIFLDTSTAGTSTLTNNGGAVSSAQGGTIVFAGTATAG